MTCKHRGRIWRKGLLGTKDDEKGVVGLKNVRYGVFRLTLIYSSSHQTGPIYTTHR